MSGRGTGIEEVTLADTQVITEQEDSQQQQADVIPAKTKKPRAPKKAPVLDDEGNPIPKPPRVRKPKAESSTAEVAAPESGEEKPKKKGIKRKREIVEEEVIEEGEVVPDPVKKKVKRAPKATTSPVQPELPEGVTLAAHQQYVGGKITWKPVVGSELRLDRDVKAADKKTILYHSNTDYLVQNVHYSKSTMLAMGCTATSTVDGSTLELTLLKNGSWVVKEQSKKAVNDRAKVHYNAKAAVYELH